MKRANASEEKPMLGKRMLAAGAVAALLVTACSSAATPAPAATAAPTPAPSTAAVATPIPSAAAAYTIAGVYENTQDAFWGTFICGAMDRAKTLGVNLKVSSLPTQDEKAMSTTLDTALLANPQGVVFNPIDATTFITKVAGLMSAGTPVVSSQSTLSSQLLYVQATQLATSDVTTAASTLAGTLGTGKVANLIGLAWAGQQWEQDRMYGIIAAVKAANKNLTWLPDQIDGFDVNKGTQQISALITANPDLKLILAPSGPEGQAAAAAVHQNGMDGKIHIIADDAVPAEVDALKAGTIDFLVAQPAFTLGQEEVQALVDWLNSNQGHAGAVLPTSQSRAFPMQLLNKGNVSTPAAVLYEYNPNCGS
jgi:ribose transport system substrate-binding protein